VPPAGERRTGALTLRILSAIVLIAVTAAAVALGPPYFNVYILVAALVLVVEWALLCGQRVVRPTTILLAVTAIAVVFVATTEAPRDALVTGAVGALILLLVGWLERAQRLLWLVFGVAYIGLPAVALLWLMAAPELGRETIAFVIVAVSATDIGAYFAGRSIGGPRLVPRLSPKKTWAGLAGGIACAAAAGALLGYAFGLSIAWTTLVGAALAVVSQAGDLFESAIKRKFGVKDSGAIIPGHGGLFDRADGQIAAAVAVAAAHWATGGSVLTWR